MSNVNEPNSNEENEHIIDEIIEVDLPATFNDLVEVTGYETRVFKVCGYCIENWYTESKSWTEVAYDLQDAVNGDWLEADGVDIELLADAEDAGTYMQTIDYENYPKPLIYGLGTMTNETGGGIMSGSGEAKKLTPREQSAQEADRKKRARKEAYEAMNNELDRYNFFKSQYEKTKDRRYKEAMDTVMAEIKKLGSADDKAKVVGTDDKRKEE